MKLLPKQIMWYIFAKQKDLREIFPYIKEKK